jgi:uncharacterized membrane protein YqjE
MSPESGQPAGIVASLRRVVSTFAALVGNRFELLVTEWQEERGRLAELLLLVLAGAALGLLTLVLFSVTLLLVCPAKFRLLAAVLLTLTYLLATLLVVWRLRWRLKTWQPFAGSLGELRKDAEQFKTRP